MVLHGFRLGGHVTILCITLSCLYLSHISSSPSEQLQFAREENSQTEGTALTTFCLLCSMIDSFFYCFIYTVILIFQYRHIILWFFCGTSLFSVLSTVMLVWLEMSILCAMLVQPAQGNDTECGLQDSSVLAKFAHGFIILSSCVLHTRVSSLVLVSWTDRSTPNAPARSFNVASGHTWYVCTEW